MHTFIFIIISVVGTISCTAAYKVQHIVFIEAEITSVCVGVLVIFIKFTAFAVCLVLMSVFRKIQSTPPYIYCITF